jgi:hypothetical protein
MKPTIGRIVHFVQKKPAGYSEGTVHLPAIIVAVSGETCVNLQVLTDGSNSDGEGASGVKWITSVSLDISVDPQPRTWHWPEREENK